MNVEQVKAAVEELERLKAELQPLVEGFGLQGVILTVSSQDKLWDCAEISFHPSGVLVLTHKIDGDQPKWCRTFLDPTVVISVEFEVFPDK